ncbi:MAG: hypothetical protein GY940_14840 [bacterium]|nr:hypothetical protein [bacterium]
MVLDYKDVSFSFSDIKRTKRIKRVRLIVLALLLVLLYLVLASYLDSNKIDNIQELLLENKTNEAKTRFDSIKSSFFHGDTKQELKALILLFTRDFTGASVLLTELGKPSPNIRAKQFLDYFSDHAAYRELEIYSGFLAKHMDDTPIREELHFYRALVKSALFQHQQSQEIIRQIPTPLKKKHEKALAMISNTNHQVKTGKVDYIFDVNGKPLAYYDVAGKKTVSLTPGIRFDAFGDEVREGVRLFGLTLDHDLQSLLHRFFRPYNGTFLLFNVSDGSIAAAYSKPFGGQGNDPSGAVFSRLYEPGSIVKLVTMLAYLNDNSNTNLNTKPTGSESKEAGLFPFRCEGLWQLEGKVFYDWIVHKDVETIDDALAVSCNLAFAHIGNNLGYGTLKNMLTKFYFNAPPMTDQFLSFKMGTANGTHNSGYHLANMSVGLEGIRMTTFHAALMAAVISQNGSVNDPYMIKNKKNLLNIGYYNHESRLLTVLKDNIAFSRVKNAMVYVVESPEGTGRRSRVDGVQVALKTGTAGSKKAGLDAVLAGFFPAAKPQYAFAFHLQRSGKAEWKGARFLKDFLTAFHQERK